MLADGLNIEGQQLQFFPGELSLCGNSCRVSGDSPHHTHCSVLSCGSHDHIKWRCHLPDIEGGCKRTCEDARHSGSDHSPSISAQLINYILQLLIFYLYTSSYVQSCVLWPVLLVYFSISTWFSSKWYPCVRFLKTVQSELISHTYI